jgi:hypothetical protein
MMIKFNCKASTDINEQMGNTEKVSKVKKFL